MRPAGLAALFLITNFFQQIHYFLFDLGGVIHLKRTVAILDDSCRRTAAGSPLDQKAVGGKLVDMTFIRTGRCIPAFDFDRYKCLTLLMT